ncbi:prepilin [Salmonella enterica]|nr:prepilin [Salmonella enterica subsp. diarizonae]EJM3429703.1 prepilin [Salmonella enterica]
MENTMLSRCPTSVHRGEANLLALVISIAVVAIMVIGVIKFGSNISDSNNVQAEYANATSLITNARARLKTDGVYDFSSAADMTGTLIRFGGVPGGMKIDGNKTSGTATLRSQWGGQITLAPSTSNGSAKSAFTLTYTSIPYEACTQLATQLSGAPSVVTTAINGTSNSGTVSAVNAGKQCVANSGSTGQNTLAFTTNN